VGVVVLAWAVCQRETTLGIRDRVRLDVAS
jgi:hypothetical protein